MWYHCEGLNLTKLIVETMQKNTRSIKMQGAFVIQWIDWQKP